jgi:hypothetical protein
LRSKSLRNILSDEWMGLSSMNRLRRLNSLHSPGTDNTENTVPLLQHHCCLAMAWRIPLLRAQTSARTAQKTQFFWCLRSGA